MSSKRTVGSAEYLEKRIPQNPKYQHVKTKLDTGCSLSKYMERVEEIKKNYRYRKDELFKRLKVTTFAQLVLQVASVSDLNEGVTDEESICSGDHLSLLTESESVGSLSGDPSDSPLPLSPCQHQQQHHHHHHHHHNHHQQHHKESGHASDSPRSTLHGVISGVGELDLERNDQKTLKAFKALTFCQYMSDRPYPDCPYLLLDTRPRAEYDLCHVISASSFPIAMLSRTMNPYTKEVLEYKNAVGRIIILYDDDERIASQAATTMCERGFENIFMLSGGLKVLTKKFPEGLTTGHAPAPLLPSSTEKPTQVRKCRFTFDDLDKIQQQLQEVLIPSGPNSRMSSRMSTNSFGSKASSRLSSSASEKESARVQGRPWK